MVDAETAKLDLEHARGDSVQGRQEHGGGVPVVGADHSARERRIE